jgi:hypothetical protein
MNDAAMFQSSLIGHLRKTASWRRSRYDDDLRDSRNLRSADALIDFAGYIGDLPSNDPRLVNLARLTAIATEFIPGQQLLYELGRFRFHDPTTTFEGFLSTMIELAERDHHERGQFGGKQVQGDEPW